MCCFILNFQIICVLNHINVFKQTKNVRFIRCYLEHFKNAELYVIKFDLWNKLKRKKKKKSTSINLIIITILNILLEKDMFNNHMNYKLK